jgi:DNA-directed RNA polymerase II subunit RPB2
MMSEQHTWNILGEHFKRKGFVQHQTESFDHFLNVGISRIISEEPDIVIFPFNSNNNIDDNNSDDNNDNNDNNDKRFNSYRVSFSDIYIPSPTVIEESRELRGFYPSEARQRDLTYDSPIYATVTETLEIDGEDPEINKHLRVVLGRIPIMLRSSKCYLTNMTPTERILAGECEYDEGGYFIVKGKERVLVSQLRSIYNTILVFDQKLDDKTSYIAEIRSMSEENGHSVLVQAMINYDDNNLMFQLPYVKDAIPIGIVFKAMGYVQDQFSDIIGLKFSKMDKYIRLIINESYFVNDDGLTYFTNENREKIKTMNPSWRKEEISTYLTKEWEKMEEDEQEKWKHKGTQVNALKYIGSHTGNPIKDNERFDYAKQVVEGEIFPHMGITSTIREKAYLLGHMVHKLLATRLGIRKPDSRDNYINKRVDSPGILCYDLFRQLFKKYTTSIVSQIEKRKQLPDVMSIIPRQTDITKGFSHCFGTGNWGVPKNSYVRQGVAQILSRLSYGATLSNIRRVSIPIGKESKNSAIRQIHPSQIMFMCPAETPEGAPVGIVLNLSLLTRISEHIPTVLVKEVIEMCNNITLIGNFDGPNEDTKVFLNGIILGMTDDPQELIEELKMLRKVKMLPSDVSISYEDIDDEINIYSDEGRLLRPVFTVKDGKLNAKEEDGTNWDELVNSGAITYIDNMEADRSVIAFHQNELEKYHNDYCEIAPAMMLGVMASIIPFPDHSQSPRNTYQAAMGKQAMSMFALSHLIRADTVVHVLGTPQRPLVSTRPADMMGFSDMPSGINCVVAIACYTGFNQEDSVIINYSAVQRGLFWATTYRTYSEEEKKQGYSAEKIGIPPLDKQRRDANYGLLDENGVVRIRHPIWTDKNGVKRGGGSVYVQNGDVIIGKIGISSNKSGNEDLCDCSLVIKNGEEGYIDRIFTSITPNGYKLIKIVIRKLRIPEVGDKFASRAAQKGTVGMVYRQEDMPWTQDGIVPDIIINPHAIPSRMTINQLMESVLGKSCAIEGKYGDSTPFTESSIDIAEKLCERLGMNGCEYTGKENLYNGMTGEQMGMFFIGPVYYQRLKHLVSDKLHARASGPVTTLTRQPLEGRSRDGGLRFGEMERDCMIGHGTSKFLQERLFEQSDKYSVSICNNCGNFSTSHTECRSCETDQVTRVKLPYVSKLLLQELNAMMIKTKITAKN